MLSPPSPPSPLPAPAAPSPSAAPSTLPPPSTLRARLVRFAWVPLVAAAAAGLLAHARRFDFICDDAFITFRYAKHLATLGAPVYNVGERVEGYTNFLWMVLAAGLMKLGCEVAMATAVLGALSACVLMAGVWLVWTRFSALPRVAGAFPLAAVALTAPIAVWTLGGLETSLHAGLLAASCGLGAAVAGRGGTRPAAALGVCLGLATLTRPESAMAFGIAFVVVAAAQVRRRADLWTLAALAGAYAAVVVPHLLWRRVYYGDFLPNTYYLKTSGNPVELRANGLAYLRVAARDFGFATGIFALFVVLPAPRRLPDEAAEATRARRAGLWLLRLNVLATLPYVVSVGGDFLGGYRFLVPILPLLWLLVCAGIAQWLLVLEARFRPSVPAWARPASAAVGTLLLAVYGYRQVQLGTVMNGGSTLSSPAIRLEPLDWTRLYARRWAGLGRWIADHAEPGDLMAGGAAGAAPYHAGIANLDLLGLCDSHVARHGWIVSSRPGHQRLAEQDYVLARAPVFLFYTSAFISEKPQKPRRDPVWEKLGYVWVEAKIDPGKHGSPDTYYFHFQMRKERLGALKDDPFARAALLPE